MGFERACGISDVPADEAIGVTIGEYDVAVAGHDGEYFALQDLCSHAAVALSEGEVEQTDGGCQIECWLHGSMFDLRTGKPTNFPATEPVATFPVDVRGGDIYVDVTNTLNGVTPQ